MSGRTVVIRLVAAIGAVVVLMLGIALPTVGSAQPIPHATTASPTATGTARSASPSPTESDTDVNPSDEPTDDGNDPTPDQSGTWIALGVAAGLAVLAGLVVALRKR